MMCVARRAPVVVVLSLVLLAGLPLAARSPQAGQKQPTPTFKVRVEYVEVDAIVHDKEGRFIADLTKFDFEVLEDGKRQMIENMALVDVPVEPQPTPALVAGRRFEPDVVSNVDPPGRVYLIVLDDLHVTPPHTPAARRIAREFIEKNLAPNDMAAVVTTTGSRTTAQDFTSNKRLLLAAVDAFVGRKLPSPALAATANNLDSTDPNAVNARGIQSAAPTATIPDPGARERFYNARTSLQTLAQLATFAGGVRSRRKALVMVGEGIDYRLGAATEMAAGGSDTGTDALPTLGATPSAVDDRYSMRTLREDLRAFIQAANRANVTLYAVDPRIYTQGGDDLVEIGAGVHRDTVGGAETTNLGGLWDDLEASQDNLRTMATETGGFAVTGSIKAAETAYRRIRDETSHYYILGYYSSNEKRDGKFRKIEVRVKRPGVEVVARKGYLAPKGDKAAEAPAVETKEGTSAPLREALLSPVATSGLPITVAAAPFRGAQGNGSVLVMLQTPPGAVKFVEQNGRVEGNLELSFVAIDGKGKAAGGEHLELAMPLKPGTYAAVQQAGLLVESRVSLPPGRYVLRVGARDVMGDRLGAVHCDLEVPDFAKAPLSMSGLVISSEQTALANPRPDKQLTTLLPGSPAAIREFGRDDELGVLVEIYDQKAGTPHDIDIVTTAVGEDGQEAYRHEDKRSTSQVQGLEGFGYLLKVPLGSLAPGSYLLRVEARSHLDVDKPIARETMIRVK